jgi:hypothetical protein
MLSLQVHELNAENTKGFEFVRVTFDGKVAETQKAETVVAFFAKSDFYRFANTLHKCVIETKAYEAHVLTGQTAASMRKSVHQATGVEIGPIGNREFGVVLMTTDNQALVISLPENVANDLRDGLNNPRTPGLHS